MRGLLKPGRQVAQSSNRRVGSPQCKLVAYRQLISLNRHDLSLSNHLAFGPRNLVRASAVNEAKQARAKSTEPVSYFYREPSSWPTEEEIQLQQHDLEQQPYVDLIIAGAGPSGIVVAERVAQVSEVDQETCAGCSQVPLMPYIGQAR